MTESLSRAAIGLFYVWRVDELEQRVGQLLAHGRWLARGARAIVAVSGGVDSMVLLHLLHTLAPGHRWRLVVAHLNHQLRGRAADADERFVRNTASQLGLPFVSAREDVKAFAAAEQISIEMAARRLRHAFLATTAKEYKARYVILAHHADDQVELFFLRLMRGAGAQGLGGMQVSSVSPTAKDVYLLRPLLALSKSELLDYARAKKIKFREDATNQSADILRNRLRHEGLPSIRRHFPPHFDKAVLRSMELIGDEAEFVTAEATRWLKSRRAQPEFDALHTALQRRIIQLQLLAHGIVPQFNHIEKLRTEPDAWVSVDPSLQLRRTRHGKIEKRTLPKRTANEDITAPLQIDLAEPSAQYRGREFHWKIIPGRKRPIATKQSECFDADKVGRHITLRHWRAGDRYQPIGMPQPVKLQDWFVNQKIPRDQRHQLLIATTEDGEIFWIEGHRIAENFKVTPATKRLLQWHWT